MQCAAHEIGAAAVAFPKSVARNDYSNVRVRFAFLGVVKSAAKRLCAHHREIIFGREEREAAPHLVVASNPGDGELDRGKVDKHISPVLAQLAVFVIGELTIIVARVLARCEDIDYFLWPQRNRGAQYDAIDQRENGRVNSDCQRQGQYGHCRKSRRLEKLPQSKPEILDHENFRLFSLRCSLHRLWIQRVERRFQQFVIS